MPVLVGDVATWRAELGKSRLGTTMPPSAVVLMVGCCGMRGSTGGGTTTPGGKMPGSSGSVGSVGGTPGSPGRPPGNPGVGSSTTGGGAGRKKTKYKATPMRTTMSRKRVIYKIRFSRSDIDK